jgi:hypothetical protein
MYQYSGLLPEQPLPIAIITSSSDLQSAISPPAEPEGPLPAELALPELEPKMEPAPAED